MQRILSPLLSEHDPKASSEGTIDPLGLYSIADSIGSRLAPGVRERQSHPRFLTAMGVGAVVCSDFEEGMVAADGVSEPWQVFEWYMVEGLVRSFVESEDIKGLPGRDKAKGAIRDGVPLQASRYLKAPTVFGFHGVYRVLAEALDIINDNRLGATGYQLVSAWEKEHRLDGFYNKQGEDGKDVRQKLYDAIKDGMDKGAVARSSGWTGWNIFKEYLAPYRFKPTEATIIKEALINQESEFRSQVVRFLMAKEGKEIWIATQSERKFHEALRGYSTSSLQILINAIFAYETFARLLQDAFDDCLMLMTRKSGAKVNLNVA